MRSNSNRNSHATTRRVIGAQYTAFLASSVNASGVTLAGYDFGEAPASLPPSDALVVRYRTDGTLDPTFGEGGAVQLDFRQGALACGPRIDVGAAPGEEHERAE